MVSEEDKQMVKELSYHQNKYVVTEEDMEDLEAYELKLRIRLGKGL